MEDPMEACESLNIDSICSRLREFQEAIRKDEEEETHALESESVIRDAALQFGSKVKQVVDEYSDIDFLGIEDSDAYMEYLKKELSLVEAETFTISEEIERLSRIHAEDSVKLDRDLTSLLMSLDSVAFQGFGKANNDAFASGLTHGDQLNLANATIGENFKIMELENQIEEKKTILNSLQDLDAECKRFDAIEHIEDVLTGLKVIEYEGNTIRLSLKTHVPKLADLFDQHMTEENDEPSEIDHELLIEIVDGTSELKNVEMFPNDVYIWDIFDATKSFRQISLQSALLDTRSPLQWFVAKVQEKIVLTSLRRLLVRRTKTLRHTCEYFDKDETIVAHLDGGDDAFIKVSHGWPLVNAPLKLASIKNSSHRSKEISYHLSSKVEELVNSLNSHKRQNLSSFVEAVEKIFVEQMQLHSNNTHLSEYPKCVS